MYRKHRYKNNKGNVTLLTLIVIAFVLEILLFQSSLILMNVKFNQSLKLKVLGVKANSINENKQLLFQQLYENTNHILVEDLKEYFSSSKISLKHNSLTLTYDNYNHLFKLANSKDGITEYYKIIYLSDKFYLVPIFINF